MGGLRGKLPITFITMLIGAIAISGIPPFSGFFSKDEILAHVFIKSKSMYVLGVIGSMFTAFYMFRLIYLTFFGKFRGTHEQEHHLHESPAAMTIPLIVLAILAVVGGYVGLPVVISEHHALRDYLGMNGAVVNAQELMERVESLGHSKEWMLIGISVAVAVIASIAGWAANRKPVFAENKGIALAMEKKWWIDELYDAVVVRPLMALSNVFDKAVEQKGIDASVNGVGRFVRWSSDRVRLVQSGQVGYYIFIMVLGMTAILAIGFFGNPF